MLPNNIPPLYKMKEKAKKVMDAFKVQSKESEDGSFVHYIGDVPKALEKLYVDACEASKRSIKTVWPKGYPTREVTFCVSFDGFSASGFNDKSHHLTALQVRAISMNDIFFETVARPTHSLVLSLICDKEHRCKEEIVRMIREVKKLGLEDQNWGPSGQKTHMKLKFLFCVDVKAWGIIIGRKNMQNALWYCPYNSECKRPSTEEFGTDVSKQYGSPEFRNPLFHTGKDNIDCNDDFVPDVLHLKINLVTSLVNAVCQYSKAGQDVVYSDLEAEFHILKPVKGSFGGSACNTILANIQSRFYKYDLNLPPEKIEWLHQVFEATKELVDYLSRTTKLDKADIEKVSELISCRTKLLIQLQIAFKLYDHIVHFHVVRLLEKYKSIGAFCLQSLEHNNAIMKSLFLNNTTAAHGQDQKGAQVFNAICLKTLLERVGDEDDE